MKVIYVGAINLDSFFERIATIPFEIYPNCIKMIRTFQIYNIGITMKLSAPRFPTWLIAVILGSSGLISNHYKAIPIIAQYSYEMIVAGFVILVASTLLRGLF